MIVRQFAPRATRRVLFRRSQFRPSRCLATETNVDAETFDSHFVSVTEEKAVHEAASRLDALADRYRTRQHIHDTTGTYGTTLPNKCEPGSLFDHPPGPADLTLELLLASQAHMGHATSLWNPANSRYIFGIREGIHIISLEVIAQHLRRAAKVVSSVAEHGGIILFVGNRSGFEGAPVKAAELAQACHLFTKWMPGTITNREKTLSKCKLKVVDELDREVGGFDEQLLDRAALKPDLVVCFNPLENYVMLHECALANIPTIGVIDTDADPTWVTYPVPANDDSIRCIQLIAGVLGRAGQEGRQRRLEAAKNGIIKFVPASGLETPDATASGSLPSVLAAKGQDTAGGPPPAMGESFEDALGDPPSEARKSREMGFAMTNDGDSTDMSGRSAPRYEDSGLYETRKKGKLSEHS